MSQIRFNWHMNARATLPASEQIARMTDEIDNGTWEVRVNPDQRQYQLLSVSPDAPDAVRSNISAGAQLIIAGRHDEMTLVWRALYAEHRANCNDTPFEGRTGFPQTQEQLEALHQRVNGMRQRFQQSEETAMEMAA